MQQFNDIINGILCDLENYSLKINDTIQSDNENYFIDDISNLYFERNKIIENLIELNKSDEWVMFIHNNINFTEIIERIQKIENDNIKLINDNIYNLSKNIKNLMKQKSLLIYMKS
jgi:hypothetical protein